VSISGRNLRFPIFMIRLESYFERGLFFLPSTMTCRRSCSFCCLECVQRQRTQRPVENQGCAAASHPEKISSQSTRKQSNSPMQYSPKPIVLVMSCCIILQSILLEHVSALSLALPHCSTRHCGRIAFAEMTTTRLRIQTTWMSMDSSPSGDFLEVPSADGKQTSQQLQQTSYDRSRTRESPPNKATFNNIKKSSSNHPASKPNPKKRKYNRKLPLRPSEKAAALARRRRQAAYEKMRTSALQTKNEPPSIWSFDALFPAPVLDEKSIREDLYGDKQRGEEVRLRRETKERVEMKKSFSANNQIESDIFVNTPESRHADPQNVTVDSSPSEAKAADASNTISIKPNVGKEIADAAFNAAINAGVPLPPRPAPSGAQQPATNVKPQTVDRQLTRMVEDRIYGYSRDPTGSLQYQTSLQDPSRAIQFREGVRLGKALTINIDRLVHFAKKDLSHGRLEEAQEYYTKAIELDPTDGRAYLGLSRIAQRRGDLEYARKLLKEGIAKCTVGFVEVKGPRRNESLKKKNSMSDDEDDDDLPTLGTIPDNGPNPFLLQALGTLEQRSGNLSGAEELYLAAVRSRPSHAAAWVSLGQLRTKELRQGVNAGRACYQSAERELRRIGAKPNAFIYTAWASMEYKKGGDSDSKAVRRARELYQLALEADPRCSVAYLQLGVMESDCGNYDRAKECFEKVLKFDQRNSRVLQAYAIMESRRPREDVDSRRVLDLFERALKANPRDAGVYQAYALYVAELGDIDSARNLLKRGTEVDKRHAPVWQAWGVLETRYSTAKNARDVFQQGIWACASSCGGQSGGRRCARLWQAWGVLEAQEGDHAAARRCFSRALDADPRNVAAVTAWTLMEADLGNYADARSIFERTLKLFPPQSDDKLSLWRAYEVMEERAGNTSAAQQIFQRSMREAMTPRDDEVNPNNIPPTMNELLISDPQSPVNGDLLSIKEKSNEVEVSRWNTGSNNLDAEVWINNGSIEGKLPQKMMKKLRNDGANRR